MSDVEEKVLQTKPTLDPSLQSLRLLSHLLRRLLQQLLPLLLLRPKPSGSSGVSPTLVELFFHDFAFGLSVIGARVEGGPRVNGGRGETMLSGGKRGVHEGGGLLLVDYAQNFQCKTWFRRIL